MAIAAPAVPAPVAVASPYVAQNFVVFTGPGTDIAGTPQTGTLASCVSSCNATPGCLGFSRLKSAADTDATQQCYLKQNLSAKTNNNPTWQTWTPAPVVATTTSVSTPASIQVAAPYINNAQLFNATKKVLDCTGGVCNQNTLLQAWDPNTNGGQRFTFIPSAADPTIGTLMSNNICVDVPNSSTALGTQLQTYPCNGTGAQKWQSSRNPAGGWMFKNTNSGMCMDVDGSAAVTNGTRIQQWTCLSNTNQSWNTS